ncbi:Six-hairpin glycosidase-like protein [Aspergillus multicolor]|uniref:Six-hairpin glycosidase-like protein n=1 Tax=Aspergillus multicolor TaxID=41759 RepID=UPI003CCDB8E1
MPSWTSTTPWLWLPSTTPTFTEHHSTGRIVLFRKTFTASAIPDKARIHISADTRYILFLNGARLLFGPAKSYLNEYNYETIDIAPFLRQGTNVLAAKVLRYSPAKEGNMGMTRSPIGGFILHDTTDSLGISTVPESGWKCVPDDSVRIKPSTEWNRALGPPFMQINEEVDGNLDAGDWLSGDFDDSAWFEAERSTVKTPMLPILEPWRLVPRSIPLLPEAEGRFSRIIKPEPAHYQAVWEGLVSKDGIVEIPANSTATVIFETEELITAFLDLKFRGGAGSRITIRCAECFEYPPPDGNPNPFARNKGDRADRDGILVGPEETYTIKSNSNSAEEERTYEPFWFRTFRYIQLTLTTSSTPVKLTSIKYRRTHYPLEISTALPLSTLPRLEAQKWKISLNTLLNCMQETFTDCPFYEQNQFAFDSRLQILYSYQLSSDDRLARKTINEFHASRRQSDGLVETHFPTPFPGINIPVFSLSWVLMVYDWVMYATTANTEEGKAFVKKFLGGIDGVLNYFDSRIQSSGIGEGMVGRFDQSSDDVWPFVDWTAEWSSLGPGGDFKSLAVPPAYRRTGVASYNSLFYAYALQKAADVNEFIGRVGIADEYRERARAVNDAVIRHCLHQDQEGERERERERETLLDGPDAPPSEKSQHVAVMSVLSGATTGSRAKELLRQALHPDTSSAYVKCSYAHAFYVLEAAVQVGLYDELRDTLLRPWADMVDMNLTTWAESAAMPRSDCHGWSCVPIYDAVVNVAGFRPVRPGFGRVRFEPRLRHWGGEGEAVLNVGVGDYAEGGSEGSEVRVSWGGGAVTLVAGFEGEVEVPVPGARQGGDGERYEVRKMRKGETLTLQL